MTEKRKVLLVLIGLLLACVPVRADEGTGNVSLGFREELFYVMAAIHAAGYNPGGASQESRVLRQALEVELSRREIPSVADLRSFYDGHRVPDEAGASLGQYISLGLLLGSAPDFPFTVNEQDLPPDAKRVAEFVPLLRRFYEEAQLSRLWAQLEPHYGKEVERYSPRVRQAIAEADGYLRRPAGRYLGRTYSIFLELLASPSLIQARIYGAHYYLVAAPLDQPKLEELRHQYLHFVLDPLAAKYVLQINQSRSLVEVVKDAPRLGTEYKTDFPLLATESLIRAIELRMDTPEEEKTKVRLQDDVEEGFILVPYFYAALQKFAKQKQGFNRYFPTLFTDLRPKKVQAKLGTVKFKGRTTPASPVLSEREQILRRANDSISQGQFLEAKRLFEEALERFGEDDEQALFGLGIATSNLRKPGLAKRYFSRAIEVTRDPRISTWSHIFLGRILDLNGRREDAVARYRSALVTAGAYPLALQAAQQGLQKPFGSP